MLRTETLRPRQDRPLAPPADHRPARGRLGQRRRRRRHRRTVSGSPSPPAATPAPSPNTSSPSPSRSARKIPVAAGPARGDGPLVRRTRHELTGFELHGRTLGLLGLGNIGSLVLQIARGFGMQVLVTDPVLDHAQVAAARRPQGRARRAARRLRRAQPARPAGRRRPGTSSTADALARLRPGAVLINTSRGGLVDETGAGRGPALRPARAAQRPRRARGRGRRHEGPAAAQHAAARRARTTSSSPRTSPGRPRSPCARSAGLRPPASARPSPGPCPTTTSTPCACPPPDTRTPPPGATRRRPALTFF